MHKKSWLKLLGIMMFAAFIVFVNDTRIAADDLNEPESGIVEETPSNSIYSSVEKNGVVLSSEDDIFYTSLKGNRATFKMVFESASEDVVFNNAYYYTRTNKLVRIVDPSQAAQTSAEFDYTVYTKYAETQLTVYYTTTNNSEEQSISIYFSRDNEAPTISDITVDEVSSVVSNNYYKTVALSTSVSETGIIQSGIESVEYYVVEDEVKSSSTAIENFDPTNIELSFTSKTAQTAKICLVATDRVGLSNELCSELFTFDNEGPEITLTEDAKVDEVLQTHSVYVVVNDTKTSVSEVGYVWVELDAYKNESDFSSHMSSLDFDTLSYQSTESESYITTPLANNRKELVYSLVVKAVDVLGNVSYEYSKQLRVLATATPYLIGVEEDLSLATPSHTAYFSVNPEDLSSIQEVVYAWAKVSNGYPSTYEELKNAIDENTYEVSGYLEINEETEYQLYAEGLDGSYILLIGINCGEVSTVISSIEYGLSVFMFDNQAPVVMIDPNGEIVGSKQNHNVNVVVNEENFNHDVYYVLLDTNLDTITSTEIKEQGIKLTVTSRMFNISLPTNVEEKLNGTYYLFLVVGDAAGNEVVATKELVFDNDAPLVETIIDDRYYSNTEVITLVIDDQSSIVKYEYEWVRADSEIDITKIALKTIEENSIPTDSILADGEYKLIVKVTDEAGNVSELYESGAYKFDVTSPVVTGVENNGYYTSEVTIKAEDTNEVTLMLDGNEIEQDSVVGNGFHKLVVTDALGNETVTYFVVNTTSKANINNKNVKVSSQQLAAIRVDNNGVYYIEAARGKYAKDSVIVLTSENEGKYTILNQETSHITISKDLKSTLAIRKYKLEISDMTIIAEEADENGCYGYVYVQVLPFDSAVELGLENTIIDNEAATLSLGLAGTFALIGIYFVFRSKKNRI